MSAPIDQIEEAMEKEPKYDRRVAVQFEILYKGHQGKVMDGESETQPDMSISVRQLLARHSRGMSLPPDREPLYFDMEIPQIRDITDVHEYKTLLESKLEQTKQFIEYEYNRQESESGESNPSHDQGGLRTTDEGDNIRPNEPEGETVQ